MMFRVHRSAAEGVSRRRRQAWELVLRDLNHHGVELAGDDDTVVTLYLDRRGHVDLAMKQKDADGVSRLEEAFLRPHFSAYADIIKKVTEACGGEGARSLETLDYAKKMIHDEAAEAIQDALEETLTLDLALARELFTLIFLLVVPLPEGSVAGHRIHI